MGQGKGGVMAEIKRWDTGKGAIEKTFKDGVCIYRAYLKGPYPTGAYLTKTDNPPADPTPESKEFLRGE